MRCMFFNWWIKSLLVRNQDIDFPSKNKNTFRNIISVERVDTVATQCLEVDSPSHTFLFGDSMIVTHNTNKKLEKESFYNKFTKSRTMMKFPMDNIMDCNFYHYSLQLSLYAYLLQKLIQTLILKISINSYWSQQSYFRTWMWLFKIRCWKNA